MGGKTIGRKQKDERQIPAIRREHDFGCHCTQILWNCCGDEAFLPGAKYLDTWSQHGDM